MTDDEHIEAFVSRAKQGDYNALRALADWFRERGRPAEPGGPGVGANPRNERPRDAEMGLRCELLALELEMRTVQAGYVRRALPLLSGFDCSGGEYPADSRNLTVSELANFFFQWYGLPLAVDIDLSFRMASYEYPNAIVVCPTDGTAEEQTREALLTFMQSYGERWGVSFTVEFWNYPMSQAGDDTARLIGYRSPRGLPADLVEMP